MVVRYIALTEDVEQSLAPIPQSDGSIKDETCLNVMSALISLQSDALDGKTSAARRQLRQAEQYHNGRAEAFRQAVMMLQGILTGEFSASHITAEDIREMTAGK